jgi:hypothetical protein
MPESTKRTEHSSFIDSGVEVHDFRANTTYWVQDNGNTVDIFGEPHNGAVLSPVSLPKSVQTRSIVYTGRSQKWVELPDGESKFSTNRQGSIIEDESKWTK